MGRHHPLRTDHHRDRTPPARRPHLGPRRDPAPGPDRTIRLRRDLSTDRGRALLRYLTNLVSAPTELVDESGSLAWHTRTTVWGSTSWARNSTACTPLRFPGQYYDPETGLHHNHHRHYDPETARYLTSDPLGLAPAPNPSAYVHNPHTWSDPLGLPPRCLNDTGREGKDVNENFVPGSAEGQRLTPRLLGGR
jgi:RHS repeat-associated protein